MNIVRSRLKLIPTTIKSIFEVKRCYAVRTKLPINYVMPEKVSCISKEKSGDGGIDFGIKSNDPLLNCESLEELEDADDLVKKMFSVNFGRRKDLIQLQKNKAVNLVRRHQHDLCSKESKIARMTVQILQMQEHQENFRKNTKSKVMLKECIDKRKKLLKQLRIYDYPRFEYLLEKLNLKYHSIPEIEDNLTLTAKDSETRLLEKYCDELVTKKLEEYRKELQCQQKEFFQEKAEKLEFIRNEEIACGATPTVSQEEIVAAKQKAASFV